MTLSEKIFRVSPDIRYVATNIDAELRLNERSGIANASASESDKYEELIVNPTLLELLTRRGDIDCGGLQYVVIRYGNFHEFVQAVPGGHVSVGMEVTADVSRTVEQIRSAIAQHTGASQPLVSAS